jgi:Flp pilus assembly protein TadB
MVGHRLHSRGPGAGVKADTTMTRLSVDTRHDQRSATRNTAVRNEIRRTATAVAFAIVFIVLGLPAVLALLTITVWSLARRYRQRRRERLSSSADKHPPPGPRDIHARSATGADDPHHL